MRVYVIAPYSTAFVVRKLHEELRSIGCEPVSYWADIQTDDAEKLDDRRSHVHRASLAINTNGIERAEAILVSLPPHLSGKEDECEAFIEIGYALAQSKAVLWPGPRRARSCYALGVVLDECLGDAMTRLARAAKVPPTSRRDVLLTTFVGPPCPRCHHKGARSAERKDGTHVWKCFSCDAEFERIHATTSV
jgi:hypothetical protein